MTTQEFDSPSASAATFGGRWLTGTVILGAAASSLVIGLTALLIHGGAESGWHAAAAYALHLSALVFLISLIVRPLTRLFPTHQMQLLGRAHGKLIAAFVAAYAIFLAFTIAPLYLIGVRLPVTTTAFCVFTGFISIIAVLSSHSNTARLLGRRALSKLQWVANGVFLLTFMLDDLDHIYGPHRPDDYYGISLLLFVGAILVRFADALKRQAMTAPLRERSR